MNKILSATLVSIFAVSAFANPFVGSYGLTYAEEGNRCVQNLVITEGCDGIQVKHEYADGRLHDYHGNHFCSINKGTKRSGQYNSGGHAIFPSYDLTATTVTYDAKERKLTKVEKDVSISIGIFRNTSEETLQLDGENGLTIVRKSMYGVEAEPSTCIYKRK